MSVLTLDRAKEQTNAIRLDVRYEEKFSTPVQDHIAALKKAGLHEQVDRLIYESRAEFVRKQGIVEMTPWQAIRAMGGWGTGWFSNDGTSILGLKDYRQKTLRIDCEYINLFPSFQKWWIAPPQSLLRPIPYGVLLRMDEFAKMNVFDSFIAVAPDAAVKKAHVLNPDPVILAIIAGSDGLILCSNPIHKCFFVAQW